MSFILQPWQLYMVILAGWINREQQEVIEYLRTENAVLKEKLGKKRILLNDDQRRRLAVKGKILGRKRLQEFGTLFTPDTILRWHRSLVAKKWDYSDRTEKKPGRPRIRQVIVDLTLKFARENPSWGYDRVQGERTGMHFPREQPDNPASGAGAKTIARHWAAHKDLRLFVQLLERSDERKPAAATPVCN
jgi:hypothetical protein